MQTLGSRARRRGSTLTALVGVLLLTSCSASSEQAPGEDDTPAQPAATPFEPDLPDGARTEINSEFFGMHDGRISTGAMPAVSVGSMRLWDTGTTWKQTETSPGGFSWAAVDTAVETAEEAGTRPMLVLGQTPAWHAQDPEADGLHGVGSSSMPELEAWRRYVTEAAERYGSRVDYQVWNEPNVVGFFSGSPQQMAELTVEVDQIVTQVAGEDATVVAPSFPLRLESQRRWFSEYWAAEVDGRGVAKHVDVVAVNLYPLPDEEPEDTLELLQFARDNLPAAATELPVWDTEINYGLPRGEAVKPIPEELQRAYVMRTYLLSAGADIARVFWYRWDIGEIANTKIAEEGHGAPSVAGEGYRTVREWLVGTTFLGCEPPTKRTPYRCVAEADEGFRVFYWSPDGTEMEISTPEATRSWTDADGTTTDRSGSFPLIIGASPVMVEVAG